MFTWKAMNVEKKVRSRWRIEEQKQNEKAYVYSEQFSVPNAYCVL